MRARLLAFCAAVAGLVLALAMSATYAQVDSLGSHIGDYRGGSLKTVDIALCLPGQEAAGLCHTFTNLPATFVEVANNATRTNFDLSIYADFRIVSLASVAAVAGDIRIDCDADIAFGSTATLGTLDNPAAALNVGTWTAIPSGECKTAGGVYLRAGMVNGNTTEDPQLRTIRLQVR